MSAVDLVLAVHNHQPVGNFEHVIEDAYRRAYRPFLEVLERHPRICFSLHQPGMLWEWMEARHPEYVRLVELLVQRGQLELLSGSYCETILPVIPERDRHRQIGRLNRYLEARFGRRPRGVWLAERVWEPQLAATLARAGIEYSVLDDAHFKSAGIPASELDGYYVTEDDGCMVRVFPISQMLRYLVPFAPPEESLNYLRTFAAPDGEGPEGAAPGGAGRGRPLLVLADDGEKFGVWTSTHELCYVEGWVERFFTALEENATWLRTRTFSACVDDGVPRGRTYLPTASYAEMAEWALPAEAQRRLHEVLERVTGDGCDPSWRTFVRGGFWRNFLAKYPESNWMHKKMLSVSRALAARSAAFGTDDPEVRQAAEELDQGQCNDAYWHGLFGGLYLPHLRSAVYQHLIRAEVLLAAGRDEPAAPEVLDFDADGRPEIVLRSPELAAVVKPDEGGAVFELDDLRRHFNLLDLMTRRPEAYHDNLRELSAAGTDRDRSGPSAVSIHELVAAKEPGLERLLVYDPYRRGACIDHVLATGATLEDLAGGTLPELAALAGRPYDWRLEDAKLDLRRTTRLRAPGDPNLHVCKRLFLDGATLEARYELRLEGAAPAEFLFGVEMAVNFLAGDAHDRYFDIPAASPAERRLSSSGVLSEVRRLDVVDEWLGLGTRFESSAPADVWRMPIETVSMSEAGFERVYQGSVLLFVTRLRLEPGRAWSAVWRQSVLLR